MNCSDMVPLLDPFIDGELSRDRVLDVEQHLTECEECRDRIRFLEAVRVSTRAAVRSAPDAQPTPAFEERLRAALSAERAAEVESASEPASTGRMLSWRTIAPLAAAAAVVLAIGVAQRNGAAPDGSTATARASSPSPSAPLDPSAAVEALIDALVSDHAAPPPPQVTEPALVKRLEPAVGLPVRIPKLQQYGARWEGGNVVSVRDQRAASFRYRLGGHRVTVYVYDAHRVPIKARLKPRVVRNVPVFVGRHRGYSIAAVESDRGIGHAIATDLDDSESAELAVVSLH